MNLEAKREDVFYILQDIRLGGLSEREGIKELGHIGVMLVEKDVELPECAIPIVCPLLKGGYVKAYPLQEEI